MVHARGLRSISPATRISPRARRCRCTSISIPATDLVYGFYTEGNAAAKAIFDAWLEPFKDLGARKNVVAGIGNTDHLSYIAEGVPGFNPIQEFKDYDVRIHHTNMDTMERMNPDDLKEASIVFAAFAYNAAMRDAMIPRAPR